MRNKSYFISILDIITTRLLIINKEHFHKDGVAPKLTVYMKESFFKGIVEAINSGGGFKSIRHREINEEQSIYGFPIQVVKDYANQPLFTISQIHYEVSL